MSDTTLRMGKGDTRKVLDLRAASPTFTDTLTVAVAHFFAMEREITNDRWFSDARAEAR